MRDPEREDNIPVLVKLDTLDQVTPKSVDFQSPLPLRVPKYRMLLLFGSMAKRYENMSSTVKSQS